MKTLYWLPLAALAAFAGDCGDPIDTNDTDLDTDTEFNDFFVNSVNVTCAGTEVTADAVFAGWAELVTLSIVETGAGAFDGTIDSTYNETHVFPSDANTAFAADGSSDTWQLVLPVVSDIGDQVDGTNTFLGCGFYDTDGSGDADSNTYDSLAFNLSATADDSALADDCAIFGHEAADVAGWSSCTCFEEFLTPVPAAPCQ